MISQDKTTSQIDAPEKAPARTTRRRRPLLAAFIWFLIFIIALGGLTGTALADLWFNYGVSYGPNLDQIPQVSQAQLGANPVGVSTLLHLETDPNSPELDRSLDMIKAGGFGFIRQLLPWSQVEHDPGVYDWALFDNLVAKAQARNLQVIFRLDQPPPWSRLKIMDGWTAEQKLAVTGPPDNYQDFYNFAAKVAERYKGKVRYYQIWNEPNLTREWNGQKVDAARYVELLKGTYRSIKAADPAAQVLDAPLAPTDINDPKDPSLNDLLYLEQMYKAGAKNYFDILGLQIYGLGYSPDFRFIMPDFKSQDLKRVNFNRPASIREIMTKYGDSGKPAWAAEYGWVAIPPNQPKALQENKWGNNVDEATQAKYLVQGIERARKEWPWIGVMTVWFFRADPPLAARPDDPTNYFSIVTPDYQPRPAYNALKNYNLESSTTAYTGWQPATNNPAVEYVSDGVFRFHFQGERVELQASGANAGKQVTVKIDGQASGHEFTMMDGTRETLAEGLSDTKHVVEISGPSLQLFMIEGFYVSRDNHWGWLIWLGVAVFAVAALVSGARLTMLAANGIGWLVPVVISSSRRSFWPYRAKWAPFAMAGALLLYYFAPVPLAIAGAALFFPLCFIRPDWAVGFAALTAPLFMHPRNLRSGGTLEFTLSEVIIVELAAAWLVMTVWRYATAPDKAVSYKSILSRKAIISTIVNRTSVGQWPKSLIVNPLVLPLVAFFLLATLSLLAPEPYHLKEALREYRTVVVEPLALFLLALVFVGRKGRAGVVRLFDFLVAAGVGVALVGLYQFVLPGSSPVDATVITPNQAGRSVATEGVTRVVSVYSHPDNLGLFLGRIIPLAVSVVLFYNAKISWQWPFGRRQWYGLALVPMLGALVVSYSRGAWIGVAVALLAMFIAAKAWRWVAGYGVILLLGAAALPFIKLERIANLFNFVSGSSSTRLYLWQSAIEMIKAHPVTGIGLDQFLYYYNPEYVNPLAWTERFTSHPHNLILDFWLSLGMLGPVVILWLLFSFYRTALRPRMRSAGIGEANLGRALVLGLLGSMVDFLIHGLVDNSYFLVDLAIVFCLSYAMLEILRREIFVTAKELADSSGPSH